MKSNCSVWLRIYENNYGKNIHQRDICTGKGDKSRSMNTERERKMDKQQVLNQLRNAKEIYVAHVSVHKNAVCGM